MARESRFSSNDPAQRLQALSRWDNEGGAIPVGPFVNPASGAEPIDIPELTNAELVALRIRVIALENLPRHAKRYLDRRLHQGQVLEVQEAEPLAKSLSLVLALYAETKLCMQRPEPGFETAQRFVGIE